MADWRPLIETTLERCRFHYTWSDDPTDEALAALAEIGPPPPKASWWWPARLRLAQRVEATLYRDRVIKTVWGVLNQRLTRRDAVSPTP